jgi:hypothetical protein
MWPVRAIEAIGIEIKERPFQGSKMGNFEVERCELSKVGSDDPHIPQQITLKGPFSEVSPIDLY